MFKEDISLKKSNKIGSKVGLTVSYFLFTTALFAILNITDKIPSTWNYFHLATITLLIGLLGWGFKSLLK